MSGLRLDVLLGAALLASPALYAGLVTGTLPVDVALLRFLVALAACAIGVGLIRSLFASYAAGGSSHAEPTGPSPGRRRTDAPATDHPATPETTPYPP
jgi:hypothetical protein